MKSNPTQSTIATPQRALIRSLVAAIVVLAIADVLLLLQNRKLDIDLAFSQSLITPAVGEHLGTIRGFGPTQKPSAIAVGLGAPPVLVYAFSTTCRFCRANWPSVHTAVAAARTDGIRVAYADPTNEKISPTYLRSHGISPSQILTSVDQADSAAYGMQLLPEMVLLDGTGGVRWSRDGRLSTSNTKSLLAAMQSLPPQGHQH